MTHVSHSHVSRATFLAAAAGFVLAACGGGGEGDSQSAATEVGGSEGSDAVASSTTLAAASAESGAPGLASVVPAALIGATSVDGEPFDAAALGGRPTVAWFWAPWCVVCRAEASDVAEIAERFAGRVNFVGVAGLSEPSAMREFVADTGTDGITHLDDSSGEIWASYEIYSQPAFAFIADDGRLEVYVGSLGSDGLADIVDKLIAA